MEESIIFFGTGPVASASLELLAQSFTIEAVVTKPRPEHHRGSAPVLDTAGRLGLPIVEVTSKSNVTAKILARHSKSRVAVLIDFGIIIEQKVIDSFPLGVVNSHFSRLPEWRGADPITFAILSGQPKTGVSLMLLVAAMDEGPLLAVGEIDIPPDSTTPHLTEELISLSYALLKDILPKYVAGELQASPQENVAALIGYSEDPTYSRKLTKEDGILDWNKPAVQLQREIRAFAEWPKSRAVLGGHAIIVTEAHVDTENGNPGDLLVKNRSIGVFCGEGLLMIDKLKPAGKNEMSVAAFLNGYGKDID